MIDFQRLDPAKKELYEKYLHCAAERGCQYSFVNLYLWGRQKVAFLHDHILFFSQFNRRSVYLFPVGTGDKKAVIQALIEDAKNNGITAMTLEVRASNEPAIKLYEKMGFASAGVRPKYYPDGEDAVIMWLEEI